MTTDLRSIEQAGETMAGENGGIGPAEFEKLVGLVERINERTKSTEGRLDKIYAVVVGNGSEGLLTRQRLIIERLTRAETLQLEQDKRLDQLERDLAAWRNRFLGVSAVITILWTIIAVFGLRILELVTP